MENTQERMIRYLDDAWAVEKTLVTTLGEMAAEVNDSHLKSLLEQHREVTHQQEENLEARIRALGEEPSGGKSLMNQVMDKVGALMQAGHDGYDKTTRDLMKGFATENFEVAMYQALESYANAIGDNETAQLARQHMAQEREAADKLFPLIGPAAARAIEAANRS